ncbi:MAG: glycosyltransferase family 2 protein [Gammaproteobacteria bacterium]|nr:glycosyltransferase family 2 protein [Gammaproteobacteria bacterium]
MKRASLSVIIICKNEERVISETLHSVYNWADEIIVLDSGSKDRTVEISKKYTEHVYETDWPGYGRQKNRALEKATCEWILSVDADEVVTDRLKIEIDQVLSHNSKYNGYKIPVKLFYFGKYIRSVLKRKPLILFKRGFGGFTEPAVHEAVRVTGRTSKISKGCILHNSYESLPHQLEKLNKYAVLSATDKHKNNISTTLSSAFIHSIWALFKDLFLYLSILDGWRGILLSAIHAQYTFNKYAFLKSLKYQSKDNG